MFERNLSLEIELKVFDASLRAYPIAIHRLGEKIRSHQIPDFSFKIQNS
jgi:hypothetical protein